MKTLLALFAVAVFLGGCATAPPLDTTKVVDQKYGTIRYVSTPPAPDFVGTSATVSKPAQVPRWYAVGGGHP